LEVPVGSAVAVWRLISKEKEIKKRVCLANRQP